MPFAPRCHEKVIRCGALVTYQYLGALGSLSSSQLPQSDQREIALLGVSTFLMRVADSNLLATDLDFGLVDLTAPELLDASNRVNRDNLIQSHLVTRPCCDEKCQGDHVKSNLMMIA